MELDKPIVNRVANSGLIIFNLEDIYPEGERVLYDLKDNLFMGIALKEKDFREFLKDHDWSQYEGKNVAVTCTEDAIIPHWAYMLMVIHLEPYAKTVVFGDLEDLEKKLYDDALNQIDFEEYKDARVVVKGCNDLSVPTYAYLEAARRLRPLVKSMMYGEPCSTVPLYKQKPLRRRG